MRTLFLISLLALATSSAPAATDSYLQWAASKWGGSTVGNTYAKPAIWGESADPDHDGLLNLLEYACDTDPTRPNPASDCYQFIVPASGALSSRYPQLFVWLRTDDPDLRITCQTSSDLYSWLPDAPVNFDLPPPANPHVLSLETGNHLRGLRQMHYMDMQSLAVRTAAFMRLAVSRRGSTVTSPGVDPFSFTPGQTVATGSTARSSSITLAGFAGTLSASIPAGATLFVNGTAQTGSSATVKAGDVLWMQASAPGIAGLPRNYTLTIGGQSATWSFTAGSIAAVPDHPGTDSGYTPVETGVSDTGAAQISIPIVVAPGTAGMQPKLSINYSSQGGNGPLGVGFSLSGLSTISRVGRTVAQDGVKGGVNFDANDRFALDGQRLIAINGADGADGTEYRLEFDPTSRIRSYGTEGNGPQRWVVETKAGLKMEFGLNGYSSIKPEGGVSVLVWAVERITDSAGNTIEFSYDGTARTRGELLLDYINYGQNSSAGTSVSHDVIFGYEDRADVRTSYVAGFPVKMLKRLRYMESRSKVSGTYVRVRRYEFAYQNAEITGQAQLTEVKEIGPGDVQLPATTFEWPANPDGDFLVSNNTGITHTPPFDISPPAPVLAGDFNADGILDMFKMNDHFGTRQPGDHWIAMGNRNGVFSYSTPVPDLQNKRLSDAGEGSRMRSCDINGDGRTDTFHLYYVGGLENFIGLSRGDGSFQVIPRTQLGDMATLGFTPGPLSEFLMLDLNSDGRSDAVYLEQGRHFVAIGNGDGSFTKVSNIGGLSACNYGSDVSGGGGSWILPGDYNGDGFADLLHLYYQSGAFNWLGTSNGDGSFSVLHQGAIQGIPTTTVDNTHTHYVTGDFNGDGLSDVLCLKSPQNANGWLAISKGDGSFNRIDGVIGINGAPTKALDTTKFAVGDFNGDGLSDVFHADSQSQGTDWIAFSVGDGTFVRREGAALGPLHNILYSAGIQSKLFAGDYDGDGNEDILHLHYDQGPNYLARSTGFDGKRVTKVTNGHGGHTTFAYKPLTDPAIYTKGSGSPYPCYDLQASMYVVSSISSRNGIDGDGFNPPPVSPVGENTVNYRYEGAWSCLDGRGFMGFRYVTVTDQASGIITQKQFLNTNPLLAGQPTSQISYLADGRNISRSDTISALQQVNHSVGGRTNSTYFVYASDSTTRSFEINQGTGASYSKKSRVYNVSYDGVGNLLQSTTETVPLGAAQTFTETVTNTYGDIVSPTQWHLGRLATSSVTKTGPNPAGSGTVSLTRSSSFAYHPTTGLLTQEVIEPNETTLRQQKDYTHDGFGNILTSTITTAAGVRITQTSYTPDGRFVATTTNAANHTESKTYDPLLGNVLTQTGPNGLTTSWEYDAIGRPIKETRPDGTVTRSFYRRVTGSTQGAPPRAVHYLRVQSSGSAPKTVWYDLLDREIKTDAIGFDGRTVSAHKVFNNRGEVTHASQPYFAGDTPLYSTMLYDAVGREYQQTDPGNRVTKTTYDGLTTTVERNYNPAALTDFQKAVTVVNAMGWTVQSSQFLGTAAKTITRKYDPYGNLRFVTDPAGNTTELRYDVRGNKTWMSEPNSGVSTFEYNGFGELTAQTNSAGQRTTLGYDSLGRTSSRYDPLEQTATLWTYDNGPGAIGQLVHVRTIVNGNTGPDPIEQFFFYDSLARPAVTIEKHGYHVFSTSRGYDLYSRPESVTYPSGFATRQVYNASGHLSEVQNGANPSTLYWRALQVNARGQVTQEALGNGIVTERAFEAETGLIQGITSTFGSSGDVQHLGFTFDLIGNLTERRDKRFSTHFVEGFGYDTLNRLQTVSTTGAAAVTCAYNDLGNLTSRSDVGTLNYASSGAGPHALTSVTGSSGGALNKTCGYDVKGNRTADGGTVLDYSSFNKPTRIRKGGDTLSFDYGPDRALYRQTIFHTNGSGATSQTVREYIGGLYEREITSEGLVRHIHHIAGGNGVVAIHTDERSAANPPERLRFIHKDHLGSVDAISNELGIVVERQSYDAWGRRRTLNLNGTTWTVTYPAAPGSAETHRGFTGHEMLDLVGLVHMGGRIYDPITARFLSPDPFVQSPDNLQNLNRYSYVLNNPLSYTDPSGFFFKKLGKFFKKTLGLGLLSNVLGDKTWNMVAAIGIGYLTGGAALSAFGYASATASIGAAATYGVGSGFGSAFSGTLLAGGSVGDALRAGLTGGIRGGISGGIFKGIDMALPDWSETYNPNEAMFSTGRIAGQAARMGARAGTSYALSHVMGGKAGVSFRRTLGWDSLGLLQDFVNETQWRSEIANGHHAGSEGNLRRTNQGFKTASKPAGYKDGSGHSIDDPDANNTGLNWGTVDPSKGESRGMWHEGSRLSNFLAFRVPGIHQISIHHDFATNLVEELVGGNQIASKAFSIGSAVPYAAFVYGRYGHEDRLRTGKLGR